MSLHLVLNHRGLVPSSPSQYIWNTFCLLPSFSLMLLHFWGLAPGPCHIWQTLPTHHSPRICQVITVVHFNNGACLCLPCFALSCSPPGVSELFLQVAIPFKPRPWYWELDEIRMIVLHHRHALICHHTKKSLLKKPVKSRVSNVRVSQTYYFWNCKSFFTRKL